MRGLENLERIYFMRRYTILFYTLIFMMVASPLTAAFGMSGKLLESLLAVCLLAAVMPVDAGRNRTLLLLLMTGAGLARPVAAWLGQKTLSALTLVVWTLIGLLAAGAALRFAMRGTKVDTEHLFAALSAYLLAGIYFGLLYWALEQVRPGTFSASSFPRSGAIYFSFVTLATLGYGDIVPRSELARGLAVVEAVGGQLFLAVLVARLLSLYSTSAKD
ncbi:MAG TPA: ion channel [Terriglobales bacterium]|nr:ion channel [Terriglobales bacterium]